MRLQVCLGAALPGGVGLWRPAGIDRSRPRPTVAELVFRQRNATLLLQYVLARLAGLTVLIVRDFLAVDLDDARGRSEHAIGALRRTRRGDRQVPDLVFRTDHRDLDRLLPGEGGPLDQILSVPSGPNRHRAHREFRWRARWHNRSRPVHRAHLHAEHRGQASISTPQQARDYLRLPARRA